MAAITRGSKAAVDGNSAMFAPQWPYAKAGFFKFKTQIPKLLKRYDDQLDLF